MFLTRKQVCVQHCFVLAGFSCLVHAEGKTCTETSGRAERAEHRVDSRGWDIVRTQTGRGRCPASRVLDGGQRVKSGETDKAKYRIVASISWARLSETRLSESGRFGQNSGRIILAPETDQAENPVKQEDQSGTGGDWWWLWCVYTPSPVRLRPQYESGKPHALAHT